MDLIEMSELHRKFYRSCQTNRSGRVFSDEVITRAFSPLDAGDYRIISVLSRINLHWILLDNGVCLNVNEQSLSKTPKAGDILTSTGTHSYIVSTKDMTYPELEKIFQPGMIARRRAWKDQYSLRLTKDDVIVIHDDQLQDSRKIYMSDSDDTVAGDYYFL